MKTTTKTAVILLPAVTATRAARIEAARARHADPRHTMAYTWSVKPGQPAYCPAHLMTPAQLEATANAAAVNALQRREQSSGLQLMADILRSGRANATAARLQDIAAEALEHEAAHAYHREQAARYEAIASRQTTDPAEAIAAREAARAHRQEAEKARQSYEPLNRIIAEATHTDLADIQSAAKVAIFEAIAAAAIDGAYTAAVKAASRAIDTSASATALTSTKTVWGEPITREEAAAWVAAHPNADKVYFAIRDSARAGYITLKYHAPKPGHKSRRPEGWYLVRHYNTVAPCISYETFTETEAGKAATAKNDGINAIQSLGDAEAIAELLTRANLTAKEAEVCYKAADQTADSHAAAAGHLHMTEARAKAAAVKAAAVGQGAEAEAKAKKAAAQIIRRAEESRPRIEAAAARESALDRAGIYAKATRYRYLNSIKAALEAAQTPAAIQTAEEAAEAEYKALERMQRSRRRAYAKPVADRPALIEAVARAAAEIEAAPVIRWTRRPYAMDTAPAPAYTPEPRDGYIMDRARQHQSPTPWSNAGASAAVIMEAWSIEEVTAASKATRAEEAAEAERRARAARIKDTARKIREAAEGMHLDPAAHVAAWLDRIGAADLAPYLMK